MLACKSSSASYNNFKTEVPIITPITACAPLHCRELTLRIEQLSLKGVIDPGALTSSHSNGDVDEAAHGAAAAAAAAAVRAAVVGGSGSRGGREHGGGDAHGKAAGDGASKAVWHSGREFDCGGARAGELGQHSTWAAGDAHAAAADGGRAE